MLPLYSITPSTNLAANHFQYNLTCRLACANCLTTHQHEVAMYLSPNLKNSDKA